MDQVFLNKLNEIIRDNLQNEKLGVDYLSHEMGMSYSKIHRKLKSLTKKSISQYIREIRLQQAMELLRNNVATVSEIAFRVGFSDPAYFNHCFHEYYGYSPGEVKKQKPDNGKITGENFTPETTVSSPELLNTPDKINNEDERNGLITKAILRYKPKGKLITWLILFLCIAGASAILIIINRNKQTQDLSKLEKSIAVLPFVNDSPDQENAYFINGIMEEIFTDLQKIKSLRIISRTSAEKYRGSTKLTIPKIAKELGVNFIVEGSGQKYGNKFILRVQLITAHNERHLWAGSFEQEIQDTKNIFKIQNQVAQEIALALKVIITPDEKQLIEKTSTTDLTAYDFYQRGREEQRKYRQGSNNKQALKKAEYLYKRALAYDSTFALAYTGLADVYWSRHVYESYYDENYLDSVIILADLALSYDDHLAEAHYTRAEYFLQSGKFEQAMKEYDKALKYNPNYSEAYYGKGYKMQVWDYHYMDFVKGLENIHKAVRINHGRELPFYLRELGDAYGIFAGFREKANYYYQEALELDGDTTAYLRRLADEESVSGNYTKSVQILKKCYARDSNEVGISWNLASIYELSGQYKEALKYVKKFEKNLEAYPWLVYTSRRVIGMVYLKNGYKNEADRWFREQKRVSEESIKMGRWYSIDANFDIAALYAFMGEKGKAYENLKMVDKIHICPLWLLNLIKNDPFFNSIRNEPEFQRIVHDLEAKYQAEHERVRRWIEKTTNL
jgi:TolB-like protein/AraC-like DNA-binding protein/Tfp pilus assembly protein PilF